jgi:tetratricopeptide (TPR) repeat protein
MGAPVVDLIDCAKGKLDEPHVMRWALRRYQQAESRGPQHCRPMEEAWFHDLALRRWLDGGDAEILDDAFRILPSRLFANLRPTIAERWSGWSGHLGASATPVLAEGPVDEVCQLLSRHLETSPLDLEKTAAVLNALIRLPRSDALPLLAEATARVAQLQDQSLAKRVLSQELLRPTAALNPEALVPLVEMYARGLRDDPTEGARLLRRIHGARFGNTALIDKATELIERCDGQPLLSLQRLFASDAPLEDCDHILADSEPWPAARALLERQRSASAVAETDFAIVTVMDSLEAADPADMASFAVAAVLHAFEREEIGAAGLSLEGALDVLALDLPDNRHAPQLTERLAAFPDGDVARGVEERMAEVWDEWGAVHLATLAGELRLVETIPMLIDCLDGEEAGDILCEAAETALIRIGESAALAFSTRWDRLEDSQKICARSVLETVGGAPALDFAIKRFQDVFRDDHEGWCSLAAAVPDRQLVDLLAPHLRRRQPMIDEFFHLLCTLTGQEHADLPSIRERVRTRRERDRAREAAIAAGDFRELDGSLDLALRCEECGDVNRYEVKSLIAGRSASAPSCFVGDDIPCASCGRWVDFELTSEARMQMMGAMLRRVIAAESGQDVAEGPVKLINVKYRWQTRPAPEVLAEIKEALARRPQDVVNHLRLARAQYVLGRPGRARACYAQALLIEPDSLEAGLGLAQIAADIGERRPAFDKLCALLERKSRWRFFRTDELSPQGLAEDLAQLYNKLRCELGVRDRTLLHTATARGGAKVGRNDPCPCGSGRKYKKCCSETGTMVIEAVGSTPQRMPLSILRRDAS